VHSPELNLPGITDNERLRAAPALADRVGVTYVATPLVGRDTEFAELRGMVLAPDMRMITMTGPVGVGKSRLAAALFESISVEFGHGGQFVDLSAIDESWDLVGVLGAALGVSPGGAVGGRDKETMPDDLVEFLRERHFLLAIDAGERMPKELAPLVTGLVSSCPRLSVLVVGPEPMGAYGEGLIRLAPLAAPQLGPAGELPDSIELDRVPAVQLFVHRARAVRPGFVLTAENREAVARLCARLDGLPLAIELAAARMKLSSPHALLADIEEDLSILSGTDADTMSRHTDIGSAIEWSYAALSRDEQKFLGRLATFTGEFGVAAAKGVGVISAALSHDLLEALVDKNLVLAGERPDGEIGFRLLGLVRDYVLSLLRRTGEYEQAMRDHAEYFLALASEAESGLTGPDQAWWLKRLAYWHRDLGAALRFLIESGEPAAAAALATSLGPHWRIHGAAREGIALLKEIIARDGKRSHQQLDPKIHEVLGELHLDLGEFILAQNRLEMARRGYEETGDRRGAGASIRLLGRVAFHQGDLVRAERLLAESVAALRAAGALPEHAMAMRDQAEVHLARGDHRSAGTLADSGLRVFAELRDTRDIALTRYLQADIALGAEDPQQAEQLVAEALPKLRDLGDHPAVGVGLEKLGILMTVKYGRMTEGWRRATRILAAGAALRAPGGLAIPGRAGCAVDEIVCTARVRLGDELFDAEWSAGKKLPANEAVAEALAPLRPQRRRSLPGAGPDNPLTARETEVASLVAAGLTNREIARRLGIAEWTAVNHLRKIMRKLDCTSRVQVAAWIHRIESGRDAADRR
jgi:predicted ATPase/DNA-binding CsgD family transcriptional regulator